MIANVQFPGYKTVAIDISDTDVAVACVDALTVGQKYTFIIPILV